MCCNMKKSRIILFLLVIYSICLLVFQDLITWRFLGSKNSIFGILINVFIIFFFLIMGVYFHLEESTLSSKEITLIAIYSAFTALARVPFVALPSVQPCSFLIFVSGIVFGSFIGFMIGANTAILSNMFLGQGPWTIYQIIAWGFVGIVGGLCHPLHRKLYIKKYLYFLAILIFILGFIYGGIMNIWSWLLNPPLTLTSFLVLYLSSFPFDLAHAISNFTFFIYFGEKTINILNRYHDRFYLQMNQEK